jgi:acetyl esterase/lipase
MKKFFVFTALSLLMYPLSIDAQNALSCNGQRYVNTIFADTTATTITYGVSNNPVTSQPQQLLMTIVQPKNDTLSRRPVIVWAFGGGFVSGRRQDMLPFCQEFARRGYVCVTIDYRINGTILALPDSPRVTRTIIQAVHDMKAAVRFLRKSAGNGNPYRLDVNNLVVGGVSAGAITAMLTAQMDSTDPISPWIRTIITEEGGFEGNSGNPGFPSHAKGALNMSGALYVPEWLDAGDVPFASYHGTADNVVAYGYGKNVYGFYGAGSGVLHPRALQIGIPSVLVTVPNGGHTDIYPSATATPASFTLFMGKMVDFTQRLICGVTPLSTSDIDAQQVKTYPNPSNSDMIIELPDNTEGVKYALSVFDAIGRSVFTLKNQASRQVKLSKTDIGSGMYFVQLKFEDSPKTILKKIVFTD